MDGMWNAKKRACGKKIQEGEEELTDAAKPALDGIANELKGKPQKIEILWRIPDEYIRSRNERAEDGAKFRNKGGQESKNKNVTD